MLPPFDERHKLAGDHHAARFAILFILGLKPNYAIFDVWPGQRRYFSFSPSRQITEKREVMNILR